MFTIIVVGLIALVLNHLSPLARLTGIGVNVPSFGLENCEKVGEDTLVYCEDAVLAGSAVYLSCDSSRVKVNKIMGINFLEPSETAAEGSIWRIGHTSERPHMEELSVATPDFHPLGIAMDRDNRMLVVNLPHSGTPAVEVYSVGKDASELVHIKTIQHSLMYTPNSLHVLDSDSFRSSDGIPSFFFSNDHYFVSRTLKHIENYALLSLSNVMFYNARTQDVYPVVDGLTFANGLAGNDSVLFVAETNRMSVSQYRIDSSQDPLRLEFVSRRDFGMATDNLHYDMRSAQVVVAGHPKALDLVKYVSTRDKTAVKKPASRVVLWKPSDDTTQELFSDNGTTFASSTTGIIDHVHNKLIISGLYEEGIMICKHAP